MSDPKDSKKVEIKLPENVQIDYDFEKRLKFFLKDIQRTGIIQEVKDRRYYDKPSNIKRKLENERRRRNKTDKNDKRRKNK